MRFGIITDVHLGTPAYQEGAFKDGKPAKLTGYAETLTRQVVQRWRERHQPELVLNLGDVLEDVSPEIDRANYRLFCSLLDEAGVPVLHVAGNHDQVHLSDDELVSAWQLRERWPEAQRQAGSSAYWAEFAGCRFIVLSTRWAPPHGVYLGAGQLEFLERSLASAPGDCVVLTHQSLSEMDLRGNHWFEPEPQMCLIHERAAIRASIERAGNVRAVFNGHAHWNHVDVIAGVPYITLQSLTENITRDAEPTPASSYALVELEPRRLELSVEGGQPLRFSFQSA